MDIHSMSPARRVVTLYAFLLGQLHQARRAGERGDIETRARCLGRARDAVSELLVALDRDTGGSLAGRLATLYSYFLRELVTIGARSDVRRLDAIIEMVTALHDAWSKAADEVGRQGGVGVASA